MCEGGGDLFHLTHPSPCLDGYARHLLLHLRARQLLHHMIEEQLQHIGELNALFWQLNIDPPVTEYMDWVCANTREEDGV